MNNVDVIPVTSEVDRAVHSGHLHGLLKPPLPNSRCVLLAPWAPRLPFDYRLLSLGQSDAIGIRITIWTRVVDGLTVDSQSPKLVVIYQSR